MDLSLLEDKEYFSIGDVGRIAGVRPHVLRYWESKFGALKPGRRGSGHRKFTRRDVEAILQIKELLYDRRFTITGAKKFLKERAKRGPAQLPLELGESAAAVEALRAVKKDIDDLLRSLKAADYSPAESL
ncbi:MAG: MerR family transcriptional regulator [Elusimicrobiota bacterium]|jgi:DNA-binding transcriptional MerR regulator